MERYGFTPILAQDDAEGVADKMTQAGGKAAEFLGFDLNEITPRLIEYAIDAAGALVLLLIGWFIAGLVSRRLSKALDRAKFDVTLSRFFANMARWLVLLLVVLMCLSIFGVQTTSFAAIIGAAGLAVGLALQGTLANFASGVMLLVFRPFKVGDAVNIAGTVGIVHELDLFATKIDTFDNRRIVIPNSKIHEDVIENITFHPRRRADVDVGVAYDADVDHTREVLEQAAKNVEGSLSFPEPAVVLQGLGASSVDWSVRVWAPTAEYLAVKQAAIRDVKNALDAAGLGIPFPQLDVHLDAEKPDSA